jgi:hypothetical protein
MLLNNERQRRIPIARCPNKNCGCAIVYSHNGKDKLKIALMPAENDYEGFTILCARCKTMIKIITPQDPVESQMPNFSSKNIG